MKKQTTNTKPRLSLIALEKDTYFYRALCGDEWKLESKDNFDEINELKDIIPALVQDNLTVPRDILCISKSMLASKQKKIGVLATLINVHTQPSGDKMQLTLIAKSRVNVLDVEKLNEYEYTACYELYNDLPLTNKPKFDKVIEELRIEIKRYYPQRQFLTFNSDVQTFADYAFKLAFFLYCEASAYFNEECYPKIEWFLTSREPLQRLIKFLEGIKQDNLKQEQKALQWRQRPDLLYSS
jgi:hypothetical protein